MPRTSMKVTDDTYRMVIKTRGIFEQLFKRKLSLDETVYLSTRLISFIYETVQRLDALDKIKIVDSGTGSFRIEGFDNVSPEVASDVIEEFTQINDKLAEKEKSSRLAVKTIQDEGE